MAPLIAVGRSIVVGFCVALAATDASTTNNNRGGACTTAGELSAGPPGSETFSENSGSDGGNGCVENNGDGGGGGRRHSSGRERNTDGDDAWNPSSAATDLEELADRVGDALVAADAELDSERTHMLASTSSSLATLRPDCPVQTTGTLCEQKDSSSTAGGQGRESLSSNGGVLVAPVTEESGAATNQGVEESPQTSLSMPRQPGGETEDATAVGAEEGEVCGDGEHRRTCSSGEECCNRSCGICAPKGQSCLPIACGGLTRGGGSQKVAFVHLYYLCLVTSTTSPCRYGSRLLYVLLKFLVWVLG